MTTMRARLIETANNDQLLVDAILDELRTPDEGMIEAGVHNGIGVQSTWRAMVDHIRHEVIPGSGNNPSTETVGEEGA